MIHHAPSKSMMYHRCLLHTLGIHQVNFSSVRNWIGLICPKGVLTMSELSELCSAEFNRRMFTDAQELLI